MKVVLAVFVIAMVLVNTAGAMLPAVETVKSRTTHVDFVVEQATR
ncbi:MULTISPECIES: hypothetical protein [unclassified Hydrogenophaga]|jgi:hypothetical protein|nr:MULTISPECIES: hypothetical protein [unclassified Hydrogenophaga]MDP3350499.1 hypothetical protein [Hydrogenophaga sp.]